MATGDVMPTSAVLWVRGIRPGEVTVDLDSGRRAVLAVDAAGDLTGKRRLEGLTPSTRYRYRAVQGNASAEGEFVTAPPPAEAKTVRFLWGGDLGGGGFCRPATGGYSIFPTMLRQPADFFLFVGDTVYTDVPCNRPGTAPGADFRAFTLEQYRARHLYNRLDPGLQALLRRMSVYAI